MNNSIFCLLECLTQWKANATHNVIFFGDYAIEIVEPGYYYIYTQIYFSDSESGATDVDPSSRQPLPMVTLTFLKTNLSRPLLPPRPPTPSFLFLYYHSLFKILMISKTTIQIFLFPASSKHSLIFSATLILKTLSC